MQHDFKNIFLLIIIYISFISLGIPDSIIGAIWPEMVEDLKVPISYLGYLSMLISFITIIGSLFSDKLTILFGTGLLTSISILLTSISMLAFSFGKYFWQFCLLSIPYGLGAGAVDASLDAFVSIHYDKSHLNWLYCAWAIGAASSPYIMGICIKKKNTWKRGYIVSFIIQLILSLIVFSSLPLWKKLEKDEANHEFKEGTTELKLIDVLKIKGILLSLISFFSYSAIEQTIIVWASTFFSKTQDISSKKATNFASLFYIGIIIGRILFGFAIKKFENKNIIRIGIIGVFIGIFSLSLPIGKIYLKITSLIIIGLGCSPIYPSLIYSSQIHFGKESLNSIIGVQISCGNIGITFMPVVFGLIADYISIKLLPYFLCFFNVIILIMTEIMNYKSLLKEEGLNDDQKNIMNSLNKI